jgi:hypothetical protein
MNIRVDDCNLTPALDDVIIGKYVKAKHTHGSYERGEYIPRFLCFTIKDECLDFYIYGLSEVKDWINKVDLKLLRNPELLKQ